MNRPHINCMDSIPKTRICSKCEQKKPLDTNNYQVVKYFKTGFSYYCNICDKPPKKEWYDGSWQTPIFDVSYIMKEENNEN